MADSALPAEGRSYRQPLALSSRVAIVLALPLALPVITLVVLALSADLSAWPRLFSSVLPQMALDTLLFCAGVSILSIIAGTGLAWLVTMYQFPGRNFLQWSSILPLAVPGYITAFVYVDTFAYAGPVQGALRSVFGWTSPADYLFPDIRTLGGAIAVMSAALYPYVYMTARAAFLRQSMNQIDVARTLGRSSWRAFVEVTLPQARPALAVGAALVLMECINDIGAVGFFGVNTLTYGIYSLWLGQGDLGSAMQLALVLLAGVGALVFFEQAMRKRDHLSRAARSTKPIEREQIKGWLGWATSALCFVPVTLGFLLPVGLLIDYAHNHWDVFNTADFAASALNSTLLAALACIGTLSIALIFGYASRRQHNSWFAWITRASTFGYAIPGTILAIGILIPFGLFDRAFNWLTGTLFGLTPGLIISGSIVALVFAYVTRFLIVASGSVEAGLLKISPHLEEAAQTLGRRPLRAFFDIHLPLLRPAMVTALLLVFVDAMKELPATLLLRPFNFETLSTHVYALASLGQLEDAAVPALTIVAVGLLPVAILSKAVHDAASR